MGEELSRTAADSTHAFTPRLQVGVDFLLKCFILPFKLSEIHVKAWLSVVNGRLLSKHARAETGLSQSKHGEIVLVVGKGDERITCSAEDLPFIHTSSTFPAVLS